MIRFKEKKPMENVKPSATPKAEAKKPADRKIILIDVASIEIHDRMRPVNDDAVATLAASIEKIGLRTPISVRYYAERPDFLPADQQSAADDAVLLIAGAHRLAAAVKLGWKKVECVVYHDSDDLDAQLWEIDENLMRSELSPSERASHTARRKAIYLELHPETGHGGDRRSDQVDNLSTASFASETAKATGKDERTVRRDAERGEKVIPEAMEMIRGTRLDTGTYLDKLKKLLPNEQVTAVKRDIADTKRIEKERADRKGRQEENERKRQEHADNLPDHIKAQEASKDAAIAARKGQPVDVDALIAELEELREANAALEAEVAALRADNAKWEAMRVQFEQGGFEKVIAGKDEVIRGLQTRVESESREKVRNLNSLRGAMKKLEALGQSRNLEIDLDACEAENG